MQQVAETHVVRLITCDNYACDDIMTSGDICRRCGPRESGEGEGSREEGGEIEGNGSFELRAFEDSPKYQKRLCTPLIHRHQKL